MKRGRPAANKASVSIAALKRELKLREAELKRLSRTEKDLRAKLAAIEKRKAALIGAAPGMEAAGGKRRGRKPGNAKKPPPARRRGGSSITTTMCVIAGERPKGVTPKEMTEALLKRGVKTKSKNFRKMIAIAMTKHSGLKRIKQGVYTLKD